MARELEEAYAEYNTRFFGGLLPKIPIKWGKTLSRHAAEFVTYKDSSMVIVINPRLKPFGCYTQLTLLHEMVHVELRKEPGDTHGPKFQRRMKKLARMDAFDGLW
jgi:hypothetical protein